MILTRLNADNFRNLAAEPFEFHPTTNIVVGRNGDLFLCEDNDSTVHIRRLTAEGRISTFAEPVSN